MALSKINVYSYIRFSSGEQRKGTGKQRQTDRAAEWCQKNRRELFKGYADLGVSAFKGRNATEGQLSVFLELVKSKKIPTGSILLVESLDRLSRQNINRAAEVFLSIINSGIKVVTLCDQYEYSAEKCDVGQLMMSLMIFARANDESKMKSQRTAANWRIRRQAMTEGRGVSLGKLPSWLEVVDGKYRILEKEAEKVKAVFRDYVGGMGRYLLHAKHHLPKASIGYWLTSPTVIGTLTVTEDGKPFPIHNHYPAIIDLPTWKKAQQLKAERFVHRKVGRTGTVNLFAGILYDSAGERMEQKTTNGNGIRLFVGTGYTVQAGMLERIICGKKFGLADKFVRTRMIETDQDSPEARNLSKTIAEVQNQMVTRDDIELLMPVLRKLKVRQRELDAAKTKVVEEEIDRSAINAIMANTATKEQRLEAREIIRENIRKIEVAGVEGTDWFPVVEVIVTLTNGSAQTCHFTYATRGQTSHHFVLPDGNAKVTDDMKEVMMQRER
jgi:DNA invertase Pin-like site-specific DNA recombinase